ncbi:MAG: xylanase [Ignavibacteria bacterium]|nr:xylanase [Ignavibacteria bacterium]
MKMGRCIMKSRRRLRPGRALTRMVWRAVFLPSMLLHSFTYAQEALIYLDSLQQVISGFGAANIRAWRPDMTVSEIQKAFGTGPGQVGLNILRLRVPPEAAEFALNVPTAQSAHAMGVKIIASPWSPPAWMKKNNNVNGGGDPNLNRLYDTSYASYAAHLKSFVDFMASSGVPLYAISVQNEPDWNASYESCLWNASEMTKFVKEQGKKVGTRLIAPESLGFNPTIANAILNDSAAAANLDIVGGHIYGVTPSGYPLAAEKGKEVWMTEYLINSGNPPSNFSIDTGWTGGLQTAKSIHDVMNAGMNAYIWWYIVRYYWTVTMIV